MGYSSVTSVTHTIYFLDESPWGKSPPVDTQTFTACEMLFLIIKKFNPIKIQYYCPCLILPSFLVSSMNFYNYWGALYPDKGSVQQSPAASLSEIQGK